MMVTERMWLRPWSFNEIQDLAMQCFYLTAIVSTKIDLLTMKRSQGENVHLQKQYDKKT